MTGSLYSQLFSAKPCSDIRNNQVNNSQCSSKSDKNYNILFFLSLQHVSTTVLCTSLETVFPALTFVTPATAMMDKLDAPRKLAVSPVFFLFLRLSLPSLLILTCIMYICIISVGFVALKTKTVRNGKT